MKAFIVEGQMEQKIIQRLCRDVPVRLLGLNGKDAAISKMAAKAAAQIKALHRRDHFFILFDRENRKNSCDALITEFKSEIGSELKKMEMTSVRVEIIVVDRTAESWIFPFLRDDASISAVKVANRTGEGRKTLGEIERIFKENNKKYNKMTDGVNLFCKINSYQLKEISESFKHLTESLGPECKWLSAAPIDQPNTPFNPSEVSPP